MNSPQPQLPLLTESLDALSLDGLKQLADLFGVAASPASKARLIKDIPAALQAGVPDDLVKRLSPYPGDDLLMMLALEECRYFLGDELVEQALSDYRINAKDVHPLLVAVGGRGNYRLFAELLPAARRLCRDTVKLADASAPRVDVALSPKSFFGDVYSVWAALLKRPLRLTKIRGFKKRDIENLSRLLLVDEDDAAHFEIASRFGISRLEFILDFLRRNRAIKADGGVFAANPAFAGTAEPHFADAGRVIANQIVGGAGAGALALAIYVLRENDAWVSAERLTALIRGLLPDSGGEYANTALYALFVTGYVRAGTARGGLVVRAARDFEPRWRHELWDETPELLVGGNFEVKIPANALPAVRLKLEAFADMVKPDVYYDYEITRDSVYRALDAGIIASEVHAFLREYSKHPIPQNVEFGIDNWERQFKQVGFEEGLFLVTEDEAVANELANLGEVADTPGEVLDLFAIKVNRSRYEYVRDYLRQKGYLPRSLPDDKRGVRGEGDVSTLFSGYDGPLGIIDAGTIDRQRLLAQTLDFARKNDKLVTLELRNNKTIIGRVVSVARSKIGKVVRLDCAGEPEAVKLSDVVDFTLD
jgi:hypothetical protein